MKELVVQFTVIYFILSPFIDCRIRFARFVIPSYMKMTVSNRAINPSSSSDDNIQRAKQAKYFHKSCFVIGKHSSSYQKALGNN